MAEERSRTRPSREQQRLGIEAKLVQALHTRQMSIAPEDFNKHHLVRVLRQSWLA